MNKVGPAFGLWRWNATLQIEDFGYSIEELEMAWNLSDEELILFATSHNEQDRKLAEFILSKKQPIL
jgi:hypothetical protein